MLEQNMKLTYATIISMFSEKHSDSLTVEGSLLVMNRHLIFDCCSV